MAQDVETGQRGSGPMDRLKAEAGGLLSVLGDRALESVRGKVQDATGRLTDYVEGGGGPGLMAAMTGAKGMAEGKGPVRSALGAGAKGVTEKVKNLFGGGGEGKGGQGKKKLKVTNIVESIDVGVPVRVAYNQWTQFRDFPSFMKKVENVDQQEDTQLHWKAQVFWSHRDWESTIVKQVPDECIVWRSKGAKGYVDGAVTFHAVTPDMTRILVVLEYNPQGLFERTGNLWRAQGRRARLELKHYRRHVMTDTILHPDEIEGWRGVIEDGKVVQDHESRLREEQEQGSGEGGPDEGYEDEDAAPDAEYDDREADDEFEDREPDDDAEDQEADDQVEDRERADAAEDEDTAEDEDYADDEYDDGEYEDAEDEDAEDEDGEAGRAEPAPPRRPARRPAVSAGRGRR
jgi:hypothetical protein